MVPFTHVVLKTGEQHMPLAYEDIGETPRGSDLFLPVMSEFYLLGYTFILACSRSKELPQGLGSLPRVPYTTRHCLSGP